MKTIVKHIAVNDGKECVLRNGDHLYVEVRQRLEKIISIFLNDGYTLLQMQPILNLAVQKDGSWNFYRGGYDLVFTKQVDDDDEVEDTELLLQRALQ